MSRSDIDIKLDQAAIYRLSTRTAQKLAGQAAQEVQARARRFAPKRTGALAASIVSVKVSDGEVVAYKIGSHLDYAAYQEYGTGPIYARPGGVLRFESGGKIVFARRTSGVPATHFMARAAATINITDFIT